MWTGNLAVASDYLASQNQNEGVDFAFVVLNTLNGRHVQQEAGALPLRFCQGESRSHPNCDGNAGATQRWTAYGEEAPSFGVNQCGGPGSAYHTSYPGFASYQPPTMYMTPCNSGLSGGASGGPWLNDATGAVGADNAQHNPPYPLVGTYLGNSARAAFESINTSTLGSVTLPSQGLSVGASGIALVPLKCRGRTVCRGTAVLTAICPPNCIGAGAAARVRRPRSITLGRSRFAVRARRRQTIRLHLSRAATQLVKRSRHPILATLIISSQRGAEKIPVTLRLIPRP